ncbi:MAG: pilus assembly protein TadG-related protein [Hyphomonadaceae bacterium]
MVVGAFTKSITRRPFASDNAGNVAMMWGLMGTVLIGLIGVTVDFTRAQSMRSAMQNAVDGAVLVAERSSNLTMAERTAAARAFFDAEVGASISNLSFSVVELDDGGHRVEARAPLTMSLGGIVSPDAWNVRVAAEAQANASPPIEVVLALDNTGSMSNDMDALRDGAQDLAEFLMGLDGDTVSVGLVPFVAQVNIGTSHSSWLDTTGTNPYNGAMLEGRYLGYRNTTSGSCTGAAYPTTFGGFEVRWIKGNASYPSSYQNTGRCYAFSPANVNVWSLYANLPSNARWGGCVEMRPPPYDISDAAPNAGTPATRWVPFFSLDDGGDVSSPDNNWITSTTYDTTNPLALSGSPTWTANTATNVVRTLSVYKYRSGVSASINTGNTSGQGPNRGCPTPIVPLTTNESTIANGIQSMVHWNGGGTNQIEGLAWAWRVISPGAPFTEGRPYNDPNDPVRKVIVLFTDGDNTSLDSNNSSMLSDYAGLGYRRLFSTYQTADVPTVSGSTATWSAAIAPTWQRSGINTSSSSTVTYFNNRQLQLCQAIRNQGIEIYAIGYDIASGGVAEQLLEDCVTQDGRHYFSADNAQELQDAFGAIGSGIGQLRLTH